DDGTIVAGYTDSKDGDVSPQANRDYWDLWILKLDKCGTIQWEKSFGGTGYESARDIAQTSDGGYIVLGETNSTDGGVIAGFGGTKDIWLLKLNAAGGLQWQKRYGGSGLDIGNHIEVTSDGSYLIAASSSSNDGDITGNHGTGGYTDGVLMKISATGVLQWSKCYGGSKNEELFDFEIINGITFLAGFTNSIDGDIPPDQKNYDVWLLALDQNGNKVFSKIYGGSQNDVAYCMTRGADGSMTLAGYTTSNDGDVSGAKGSQDYWILNVDQKGKLNWQKVLGGTDAEYAKTIITDKDSTYIIGGVTYSTNGDITNPLGEADYWTIKLSMTGNVIWKQNWGGEENDHMRFMVHNPATDEYYLAGDSESDDGDFTDERGETDFGIIKLKLPALETKDSTVCNISEFVAVQDTLADVCGNDSAIVSYKPVVINGPFNNIRKADTVFTGQSVTLYANGNGSIIWNADPTLSCTACTDPVATPVTTTIYTATNYLGNGCQVPDQFTVVVLNDAVVMMPNAFTPNDDGLNDDFGPIGKVPDGYKLQLFNRNGEVVFKSTAINNRWDGRFKGQRQPTSVFIYFIEYKDLQNKPHQQKGTFTLIR
ncbi:MAG TPA: gliding motility-associated C-terminal domain-containing protein, partial [Chitinophagaceae bacterium]|nr:gliding motility-associated C-terminal domain-containing protein [Chitinophagaceae bacterium]